MDSLTQAQPFRAPIVAIDRLRMQTDGQGITTLVAFYGCPLRCQMCLNPFTYDPAVRRELMSARELYEQVKLDDLYFQATNGGVTFGGGEPLLYPQFLREFREICQDRWHLCVETSLAVPWEHVCAITDVIDVFYVDCKDPDPAIYKAYTGSDNQLMLDNLQRLLTAVGPDRILLRLPLIPGFNTTQHRCESRAFFEAMGITQIDEFTYIHRDTITGSK